VRVEQGELVDAGAVEEDVVRLARGGEVIVMRDPLYFLTGSL
jgi:hypothetical protein